MGNEDDEIEAAPLFLARRAINIGEEEALLNEQALDEQRNEVIQITYRIAAKEILIATAPFLLNRWINSLGSFGGAILFTKLGRNEMIASSLITPTQLVLIVVAGSSLNAMASLVGHAYGSKDNREIGELMLQGSVLSLIVSIPPMVLMWFSGDFWLLLGIPPEITDIINSYFHIVVWSIPALYWSSTARQMLVGVKKPVIGLINGSIGLVLLGALGYSLTFGAGPISGMGVRGFGYACLAQSWFTAAIYAIYIVCNKTLKREYYLFDASFKESLPQLKKIWSVGWPIIFQLGGDIAIIFFSSIMAGKLGDDQLVAQNIANQYAALLVAPSFSVALATSNLAGQAFGEKSFNNLKCYGNMGLMIAAIFAACVILSFSLLSKQLTSAFIDVNKVENEPIVDIMRILMILTSSGQLFDTLRNTLTGYLRGVKDPKIPVVISLLVLWGVGMPLSYAFGFPIGMGVCGLAVGADVALVLATIGLSIRRIVVDKKIRKKDHFAEMNEIIPVEINRNNFFYRPSSALTTKVLLGSNNRKRANYLSF